MERIDKDSTLMDAMKADLGGPGPLVACGCEARPATSSGRRPGSSPETCCSGKEFRMPHRSIRVRMKWLAAGIIAQGSHFTMNHTLRAYA